MIWKLSVLTVICCLAACTAQKKMAADMDEVVKQYLGTSAYIAEANATDEYVLCYTENKSQLNSMASIKFAVYHKASNNLVFKGNIRDGYIKWINDFELEQFDPPGLAEDGKTENDYKKVINVKTYKK